MLGSISFMHLFEFFLEFGIAIQFLSKRIKAWLSLRSKNPATFLFRMVSWTAKDVKSEWKIDTG